MKTVELECSASGNPYPTYSWYRGLNYFADTTNIKSAYDNRYTLTGGKFTIEGPESTHDLATYHCKSENDVGAVLSNQAKILFGCKSDSCYLLPYYTIADICTKARWW